MWACEIEKVTLRTHSCKCSVDISPVLKFLIHFLVNWGAFNLLECHEFVVSAQTCTASLWDWNRFYYLIAKDPLLQCLHFWNIDRIRRRVHIESRSKVKAYISLFLIFANLSLLYHYYGTRLEVCTLSIHTPKSNLDFVCRLVINCKWLFRFLFALYFLLEKKF